MLCRDSEIRYLRTVAQEIADAGDQRGRSIAAAHPRLAELELEYGKAEVQSRAHGLQDGVPLAEGLVSFTVVHHAAPPAAGGAPPLPHCDAVHLTTPHVAVQWTNLPAAQAFKLGRYRTCERRAAHESTSHGAMRSSNQ